MMCRKSLLSALLLIFYLLFHGTLVAQRGDTVSVPKKWYQTNAFKTTALPITLVGIGLYVSTDKAPVNRFTVQRYISEEFPDFESSVDDYLRYAPAAAVYGLDLLGVESKNTFKHRSLIFLKANIFGLAIAFPLKGLTKVRRPDNSSSASFPSIHTTQAFISATFMHKELGHKSIWYSVGGYAAAVTTGVYRMLNNKHWLSDVMVGAGLGILATNFVYLTHQYDKRPRKARSVRAAVLPEVSWGAYGAAVVISID